MANPDAPPPVDPFFRNAYALIANTGLTGALGSSSGPRRPHLHDPDVGRGSALISAMTLLSGIVAINLAGTLGRFIPESGERTAGSSSWRTGSARWRCSG